MPALPPHDHKRIAVRTALAASIFLGIGFALVLVLRWLLAYPGSPLPLRAFGLGLIAPETVPGGLVTPELYNQLGAMHGTIMIFLAVVPLSVGGFGTYLARSCAAPAITACAGSSR